jgi:hypothetical protein
LQCLRLGNKTDQTREENGDHCSSKKKQRLHKIRIAKIV